MHLMPCLKLPSSMQLKVLVGLPSALNLLEFTWPEMGMKDLVAGRTYRVIP